VVDNSRSRKTDRGLGRCKWADCVEKLGNWAPAKISLSRASRHLRR
jgi:hypothetical protein